MWALPTNVSAPGYSRGDGKMFATSAAGDAVGSHGGGMGRSLRTDVRMFPTASANDWKGSSKAGQRRGQLTDPAMGVIPPSGQLNPTWVEWLMGFPIGWTVARFRGKSSRKSPASSEGS